MDEFLELLGDIEVDPEELKFAIESVRQQRSLNLSMDLMEKRHRTEEALDRANNPRSGAFFEALARAREEGIRSGYGI